MLCYSCCFWCHLFLQLARFFSFDDVSLMMLRLPGVLSHPDGSLAGTSMAKVQLVPSGMLSSNALDFSVVDMDHGLPCWQNRYNHPGGPHCPRDVPHLGNF